MVVIDGQTADVGEEIDPRIRMLATENGIPVQTFGRELGLNRVTASWICNLNSDIKDEDQAPGKNPVVQAMLGSLSR